MLVTLALLLAVAPPSAFAGEGDKREVPDYDGRDDPGPDAGEVLLWVPRIIVSPLYFVSEYVIRRPIGWLVTEMERGEWLEAIGEFVTFGGTNAGLIPTFLFDFGLEAGALPSYGLYFFWDDVAADGHDLRLRFAYGGSSDWIQVDFANRFELAGDDRLSFHFGLDRRKDWVFGGIGPGFTEASLGRYGQQTLGGGVSYQADIGERGGWSAGVDVAQITYFRGRCCGDPTVQTQAAAGAYALPVGLESDHLYLLPTATLAVDTRAIRPGDESGVRATVNLGAGVSLGDSPSYLRYGGSVGAYWDIWNNRTVGLKLHADFATSLGDDPIPFSQLAPLGGAAPMRAFSDGWLRGESAVAATLEYRWPIWVWLDGTLFFEAGNAFGDNLDGLAADDLRLSFGLGVRPGSVADHNFEILFALGTDELGNGADIDTFRVVFGTTSGF